MAAGHSPGRDCTWQDAEHQDTLVSMYNLAKVLSLQGLSREAGKMHSWPSRKRCQARSTYTRASTSDLASVLSNQGKFVEAEEMLRPPGAGSEVDGIL